MKPNFDFNYTFPINLASNKSEKRNFRLNLVEINKIQKLNCLCVFLLKNKIPAE